MSEFNVNEITRRSVEGLILLLNTTDAFKERRTGVQKTTGKEVVFSDYIEGMLRGDELMACMIEMKLAYEGAHKQFGEETVTRSIYNYLNLISKDVRGFDRFCEEEGLVA